MSDIFIVGLGLFAVWKVTQVNPVIIEDVKRPIKYLYGDLAQRPDLHPYHDLVNMQNPIRSLPGTYGMPKNDHVGPGGTRYTSVRLPNV